ncbi:Hsp20/alpha crystallin family protein [Virgibacillus sp. 179-BFC.A HS]|uniref:Hsp20/alpha crystallin family protein n=1 Tax=Tigheibacillus jepli TaxID=3035914 RepID=A0ABU5CML0_9BACI|nr:Hsp20/alpha crystallin family protein [Virgibacillus sp. 179-BFC.A HS]MDY0407067.1 Hsp20/alpha crystallin family protein [Virgibacillus sp. 179-BFC.A HS]
MSLVPYEPFRQLSNMRRDFDHFFSDFPAMFGPEHGMGHIHVDVHETAQEVVATCDIPGLEKKEDVQLSVENNMLQINGTIRRSNEVNEENMSRKERFVGQFHRSVSLPSPVSSEGVTASYKNGVLEVRMPKKHEANQSKIDVQFH